MLPLQLFGNSIFTMAILATGFTSMVMMALVILVPLDYQLVSGLSPKEAGLRMIAMMLGSVTGSFIAEPAAAATRRYRPFSVLGAAVATAMCLMNAFVGLGHSLLLDTVVTLLPGLSFG